MIIVKYIGEDGGEHEIQATGLGNLCWKLESAGIDTSLGDRDITLISITYKNECQGDADEDNAAINERSA